MKIGLNVKKKVKLFYNVTILILSFIIVIMLIKGLIHLAYTRVIAEYSTGDGLGGTILTIQSNNTFIYKTYLDIAPTKILRGTWTKRNDTIILDGKGYYEHLFLGTKKFDTLVFENAKLKLYHDSIVYISGKSEISFMTIRK